MEKKDRWKYLGYFGEHSVRGRIPRWVRRWIHRQGGVSSRGSVGFTQDILRGRHFEYLFEWRGGQGWPYNLHVWKRRREYNFIEYLLVKIRKVLAWGLRYGRT